MLSRQFAPFVLTVTLLIIASPAFACRTAGIAFPSRQTSPGRDE